MTRREQDQQRERLRELQADEVLGMLDASDVEELRALERALPDEDALDLELAAAELAAAAVEPSQEVPSELLAKLRADAQAFVGGAASPRPGPASAGPALEPRRVTALAWAGWLVAAACLVVIATLARPTGPRTEREEFIEFVATAKDVVRLPWTATEDENIPAGGVRGEVVWSPSEQRGYMRFEGMPVNDPGARQYQLWIFDGGREGEAPVDGGVFDIGAAGEMLVPIDAKLLVNQAAAFAVTLEKPGGVVVSKQEHVLLLAQA